MNRIDISKRLLLNVVPDSLSLIHDDIPSFLTSPILILLHSHVVV